MNYEDKEKHKLQTQIHRLLINRGSKFTNFIEFRNYKIVYRRFVGLYFIFCIDLNDSELIHLEFTQLMVECLDQYFGNVCELDIVFNFHKVFSLLDEMIIGGEIMETSKNMIMAILKKMDGMD